MQRRHKYLWMKGTATWDFNQDGKFKEVMIPKKHKKVYRKVKRNYFKKLTKKEIQEYL